VRNFGAKTTKPILTRENLLSLLLYEKRVRKMLMKLTPGEQSFVAATA